MGQDSNRTELEQAIDRSRLASSETEGSQKAIDFFLILSPEQRTQLYDLVYHDDGDHFCDVFCTMFRAAR